MRIDIEGIEALAKHGAYVTPGAILALVDRLRESERSEQPLAAHVERLTGLLREYHEDFMSDGSTDWEEEDWDGRVAHALEDTPATSLARRDAALMRRLADQLEEAEAPDAEGGDMWDASQCADWIREQAERPGPQADPDLCVDEGCPHHGTPHVCINRQAEGGE